MSSQPAQPSAPAPAGEAISGDAARRWRPTQHDVEALYQRPPSFTPFLPWVEYLPDSQCFLLEDGVSVGALFDLTPVGTEARTVPFMQALRDTIQTALSEALPELDEAPWVLQLYVQDEPSLESLVQSLATYPAESLRGHAYTRVYQALMQNHCTHLCAPGGLFVDTALTGGPWRGQIRRVRAVLYRRFTARYRPTNPYAAEAELNQVATQLTAALAAAGVASRRGSGADLTRWLLPWFNPGAGSAKSVAEIVRPLSAEAGDRELPYGHDFAEALTLSLPRSDAITGTWWFDELPHTVVSIQGLRRAPEIGHMTAERAAGDHLFSVFDRLPEHTIMVLTLTATPQDTTRNHVAMVKRAAVGDSADAALTREDADRVEREMAGGNKLYPLAVAFYVRGHSLEQLHEHVNQLQALLLANGLHPIGREGDLLSLDSYLRNLPMAYDPAFDRKSRRSRLVFARHIANLLPVYGRSRGTGHPGLVFFNRGAEPLVFDPLHPQDRKKNAHMLILGPTGAGKSALLVYLLQQMMAVHRPRLFILEAGGSFSLLAQHFASHAISVNQVTLNPGSDVSLPPFADALKLLERDRRAYLATDPDALADTSDEDAEGPRRDVLGEMEIAARIMITGGDEREDARMTRADRLLIRNAILLAAKTVAARDGDQVLTRDVVAALKTLGQEPTLADHRRHRATEMADGMALFCSGLAGEFFDRPGSPWPDVDVTLVEMGLLAREGYEDQLTVAYTAMMSHINQLVERHQNDGRPTLVVTDEGHIITTNPLLARYVVKITKMWRKLGAWFWIATQNLEDFPDASRRMLNMMEWWLCLVMPKEEVEQIARFRDLTAEQRSLLLSARKEPGKFVEGVVLSDQLEGLFRNVPPPLSLALAMTEKHEKAERARIMRERDCTELEAVYVVAERLEAQRVG